MFKKSILSLWAAAGSSRVLSTPQEVGEPLKPHISSRVPGIWMGEGAFPSAAPRSNLPRCYSKY